MTVQNIFAKIQFNSKTAQGLELDDRRHELSQAFDSALKRAKLGQWTGSAIKTDGLVFYFLVKDVQMASDAISECFAGYEHRSQFKGVTIGRM